MLSLTSTASEVALPGAAEQERFKAFFTQGEALYQQGEYGAAIWNFRQADSIRVTPEVAFDLAKCHEKIGDVAFSTFWYRQYLKRAPNASDALDVAERVGNVLARAEGEGRGLLEVQSPGAIDLAVNKASFAEPPVALFLPPGEYELSARFPSGVKTMVAQIRTGKTTPISFEPMPPPLLDAASAEVIVSGKAPSRPVSKLKVAGITFAGVGIGLTALGSAFAVMSNSDAGRCCGPNPDRTLSYSMAMELQNSANSKAIIANSTLWPGMGFLAVGLTLFVLSLVLN
ncbi:MAG: hypothetical protein IPJ65_38475 [Archangiaceae bacterium]|nr:hypothetical protein [Archangiaceae bacterium]